MTEQVTEEIVEIQPIRENGESVMVFRPFLVWKHKATSCWQLRGHSCSLNSWGNKQREHRLFDAVPVKADSSGTFDREIKGGQLDTCQSVRCPLIKGDQLDTWRTDSRLCGRTRSCVFTTGCCFPLCFQPGKSLKGSRPQTAERLSNLSKWGLHF